MSIESTLRHAASLADEVKPEWCEHNGGDDCPTCELYDDLIGYINAQLSESESNHNWCADTPTLTCCSCDLDFDSWYAFITHCLPLDDGGKQ